MSVEDMQFALVELKESHPWLCNYHSKMLQMVVHQIDAARSALKTLSEHGRKTGKLKYSEECNTFVYNQSGFKIERHGKTHTIWLSKVDVLEIRMHRRTLLNIKQVSVTKKPSGKWFANIVCEEAKRAAIPRIDTSKCVGIDLGITKLVHDSDNHEVENPLFLKQNMLKPLRRADRRLSRRQFGSNNYQKAKHMRARLWERIYNKRHDFLHKLSTEYVRKYDLIFVERLQINNMVKNHHLARSIIDSGWGYFKEMLQYKAKIVLEVNPAYTSIDCSKCGNKVPKSLAVRTHHCDRCGTVLDRDYNAALNILQRGRMLLCLLPMVHGEVTPVEIVRQSMKQEEAHEFVHG
jgi:putative transposase